MFLIYRTIKGTFISLFILFFIQALFYNFQYHRENSYLNQQYLQNINHKQEEITLLSLLNISFNLPSHVEAGKPIDYNIQNPFLKILGPPSIEIIQKGGHCGRRSRLLINLLQLKGIKAHKVHLINHDYRKYGHNQEYVHAVVEAYVSGSWVIADPLYNIVFFDDKNNLADLHEIQTNQDIFRKGISRADTYFLEYLDGLYTYNEYRKFIWSALPFGNTLYEFLIKFIDKSKVDNITTPFILEKPYLLLSICSYSAALFFVFCFFVINRFYKKR
jgi:Transglutaminase-like superfamily